MIIFLEIFSTWIFIWFILYYLHIININPFLYLIIALIYGLVGVILLIINQAPILGITIFLLINVFMKLIPMYLLSISSRKFILNYLNIGFGLYLLLIYLSFMILFIHKNPFDSYIELLHIFKYTK